MSDNKIADYLQNEGRVALLDGNWGSGKTYQWENCIKPNLGNKQFIYISLFGKRVIQKEFFDELVRNMKRYKKISYFIGMVLCLSIILLPFMKEIPIFIPENLFFFKCCFIQNILTFFGQWQNVILSIIFGSITSFAFRKFLFLFMAEKFLGINHYNIPFNKLVNPKQFVLCFDDLERLSSEAYLEEVLSFVDILKSQGFSILLISNSKKIQDQKIITEYKEKVINITFYQEVKSEDIDSVLNDKDLDEQEKAIIKKIFLNLANANEDMYHYPEIIKGHANNFRYIKNIIEKLKEVKFSLPYYNDTDKNQILIPSIAAIIAADDQSTEVSKLTEFNYNKSDKKSISSLLGASFISVDENGPIYQYIKTGEITDKLKYDLWAIKSTDTEAILINGFSWHDYRTTELKAILQKCDKHLINKNKNVFSSIRNCQSFVRYYCHLCTFCEIVLDELNSKALLAHIFNFISKSNEVDVTGYIGIDLRFDGFISMDGNDPKSPFFQNANFLNNKIESFCVELIIKKSRNVSWEDLLNINNLYQQDTKIEDYSVLRYVYLCSVLSNKKKTQEFFNLKNVNYKQYKDSIYKLIKSDWSISREKQKIINKVMQIKSKDMFLDFLKLLRGDIIKLIKEPTSGLVEKQLQGQFIEQIDKLLGKHK